MVRMFARHTVNDFGKWKKVYDDFDQERRGMGVVDHGVYQTDGNPNDVTVWHDFKTLESARSFKTSPRLREVMKKSGVHGEPTIWLASPARTTEPAHAHR